MLKTINRIRATEYAKLLKTEGKHNDGGSLYLVVRGGSARWEFQYREGGKLYSQWLGSAVGYAPMSLAQAREARVKAWLDRRGDGTPRQARHAVTGKPFADVVPEWLAVNAVKWADTTRDGASRALLRLPFASKAVGKIKTDDVLPALKALPDRQRQDVRQWLARLFDFAEASKWMAFDADGNPAKFEGSRATLLPKYEKSGKHHARVSRSDVPALYASIVDGDTARALRFLILTAARAGDVEGATWSEIHPAGAIYINGDGNEDKLVCDAWIIPAARYRKGNKGRQHIVPLPPQAKAILGERGAPNALLFGKLPANAMLNLLQKAHPDRTVHGMRSTFRDWAGRQNVPVDHGASVRDLAELSLGHNLPGSSGVERAYARDGLYDLRAPLMEQWAAFATGGK